MRKTTFEKASRAIFVALGVAVTACLVCLVTLLMGGIKPGLFSPDDTVTTDPNALPSRLTNTPDYGQSYINDVIFLGDKTIGGITKYELLKGGTETRQVWVDEKGTLTLDFGIANANVIYPEDGTAISIAEAAARKKPGYIVITVGLENGVAYCSEEKFTEYYGKLIDTIQDAVPNTKIILQSVFPVTADAEKSLSGITNRKIDTANGYIERLAEEMGVRYLHTAEVLKNKSGALDEKYASADGVTLNESGYAAMLQYLRTHGYKSIAKETDSVETNE